jgi:hypothetical protein
VILDSGVFVALDNPSQARVLMRLMSRMADDDEPLSTTEAVLAQSWRNPKRQVLMKRLAAITTVHPFGDPQTIGVRCATSGTSDVVDAGLAVLADQLGDVVLTTDPDDMAQLGAVHLELGDLA